MLSKRIQLLDRVVANQIAAGEVVERPASVVKELLENSIDAKATKIEVEIEGGGIHLIRVRDNGQGIVQSDLALAFARHATSKLQSSEELSCIQSLGFRGEALASIASVSRCRLTSKAIAQDHAWQIQIYPDLSSSEQIAAHPQGTTIEVADLFYNTPVRRKFLRSEKTEFLAIDDMIKRLSLAYPQISFLLKHQNRQVRTFMASKSDKDEVARVGKICGQQFIEKAIGFTVENSGMHLRGWISPGKYGHRQADCQYFFVNQRMVKDRLLSHSLKMIYQQDPDYIEGTYPNYVIFLNLDPKEVDVNVHPTKQEVRFSEPRLVHDFISKCITMALSEEVKEATPQTLAPPVLLEPKEEPLSLLEFKADFKSDEALVPLSFFDQYAFVEEKDGIILIDLQKAKTSLISFYIEKHWGNIASKALLFPLVLNLKIKQDKIVEHLLSLKPLGFHFQFENQKLALLSQPHFFVEEHKEDFLLNWLQQLSGNKTDLIQSFAQRLSMKTLNYLMKAELACELSAWLKRKELGSWVKLSHETIQSMMQTQSQEV